MRTIGVGLIGTGYMGKCHALAWTGVHAVFDNTPIVRIARLPDLRADLAPAAVNSNISYATRIGISVLL